MIQTWLQRIRSSESKEEKPKVWSINQSSEWPLVGRYRGMIYNIVPATRAYAIIIIITTVSLPCLKPNLSIPHYSIAQFRTLSHSALISRNHNRKNAVMIRYHLVPWKLARRLIFTRLTSLKIYGFLKLSIPKMVELCWRLWW